MIKPAKIRRIYETTIFDRLLLAYYRRIFLAPTPGRAQALLENKLPENKWAVLWQQWADSEFSPKPPQDQAIKRNEYLFAYGWDNQQTDYQFSYAHQPILIRTGEPAHNGYLHRLDGKAQHQHGDLTATINFGVHGSSNMFKHRDFHRQALVSTFQLDYQFNDPIDGEDMGVGINGDYRFGHFHLYPTWYYSSVIGKHIAVQLALPTSLFFSQPHKRWRLGIERYGEKWAALDRDREVESALYLQEWRLVADLKIARVFGASDLFLRAGMSFDTSVMYRDLVQGRLEKDIDSALFFALLLSNN